MADVELVIKLPEELKEALDNSKKETAFNYMRVYNDTFYDVIRNGTPLPKGHGRLIDVSEYFKKEFGDAREFLDKATTIIEADRSEE